MLEARKKNNKELVEKLVEDLKTVDERWEKINNMNAMVTEDFRMKTYSYYWESKKLTNGNSKVSNKLVRTAFELRISKELVKVLKRMYNELSMVNEDNLA